MRQTPIALMLIAVVLAGCDGVPPEPETGQNAAAGAAEADPAALEAEARAAVAELATTLMGRLKSAVAEGGPASAIEVCHEAAPAIAADVSARTGFSVTRVSTRYRNPEMGVPESWEAEVLEDFERRKRAGSDPATLVYSAIAEGEYRFMKAIPTGPLCLNCHGSALAPAVSARLSELYPDDRATGYEVGDIRGAFVVTRGL